jgi:aspartyl-tRNA(Asn)/glutamyl-tRNA(Gln) amidotransferase subunit B
MMDWDIVIGIETHVQLQTKSKIFSNASTEFGKPANENACLISLAYPGTLPVLNKAAVQKAIKFGIAVNAEIAHKSVFARKNYFYPDLPKGYQISQFELPIVNHGQLEIETKAQKKSIRILRAHLEEDAGKSVHGIEGKSTGIDLNRAGTPLLEIVTEPDMNSAEEAIAYAKKLHSLVQWIGICDGNMQEGSFRCDVNVSVKPKGSDKLGTRREIKNLNSFKFMEQAINFEVNWQIEQLEDGQKIQQSTVLFNPETGETRAMRSKEEANDYRYFPDPDLLPLEVTDGDIEKIKNEIGKLPQVVYKELISDYGLSDQDAGLLVSSKATYDYFATLIEYKIDPKITANWIVGNLYAKLNENELTIHDNPIKKESFAKLIERIADKTISNNAAKKVFDILWQQNKNNVDEIIEDLGLKQVNDTSAIEPFIDEVIQQNPDMISQYKDGKDKAFNALVGQVMKLSKGKANPGQVSEILRNKINAL